MKKTAQIQDFLPSPSLILDNLEILKVLVTEMRDMNTVDEVIKSLDKHYVKFIQILSSYRDQVIGETSNITNEHLIEIVKRDYKAYENIKNRNFVKNSPLDIQEKFNEFIDNMFDYENVMAGTYIEKTRAFENQIQNLQLYEFQKSFIKSLILIFVITSLLGPHMNEDKVKSLLDVAIQYSEEVQSYADTMDVLTSD